MTTAVINFPIRKLSRKTRAVLCNQDPRTRELKSKTLRFRYPYGSKTARVTTVPSDDILQVEMSLFRAISGQNALTLPTLPKAVKIAFKSIAEKIAKDKSCQSPQLDPNREITLSMVDLVRHYRVGTQKDVGAFLTVLHRVVRAKGRWKVMLVSNGLSAETVQIELPELKIKVKFYDKYADLHAPGHKLPKALPHGEQLLQLVRGYVRMEITVKLAALKQRDLVNLDQWTGAARNKIFNDVLEALNLNGHFKVAVNDEFFDRLPNHLRPTYLCWIIGKGFEHLPRSTKFKHERILRDDFNLDIDSDPKHSHISRMKVVDVFAAKRLFKPTEKAIRTWLPRWAA